DRFAAARAARGVIGPSGARGHPYDVRGVEGDRGDQYVVAVGDEYRTRVARQSVAQAARDGRHTADTVELVAAEIEQHDRGRARRVGDVRDVQFVDLEGGGGRVRTFAEGRHQACVHVGAVRVRGDRSELGEGGRCHTVRRG